MTTSRLDIDAIRARFPALSRREHGRPVAYLDGPGGTQVPKAVIDAMNAVLTEGVSNLGGDFGASQLAEDTTRLGREAMADFFNADPSEISFGQNMTSITFAVSRALARAWEPGDAIVVTSLDHDANFTPWVRAAEDVGAEVRVAHFDVITGELDPAVVADLLDDRVRLVAVCVASNAIGTLVDVTALTSLAHEAGAMVYLDSVHAGPHHLVDVRSIDCDFLVASAYKFFGPHTGILFGKLDRLAELEFYKVRPAPSDPPDKLETGTQSFESIAGVTAAVDYLASLGDGTNRRARLVESYRGIQEHEHALSTRFIEGVTGLDRVTIHGVPEADERRVATFALSVQGISAHEAASRLSQAGLYVWSGHYYALNAVDRLGFLDTGGLLRIGFVHYNTDEEVDRALESLAAL
ncbi:MAG TPA: cysteine desulfurase-like protein [Acidimicrobiia bacterium]|nr:cysteine desulfurase-like protein [Acidimicrobiia bacterium]